MSDISADEADSLRYEIREQRAEIERLQSEAKHHLTAYQAMFNETTRLRALLRPFVDMVAEPEDFAAARRALEGK